MKSNSNNCNDLKEKLINYRREMSKKKSYPAYYIFTNDQLDRIIEYKPKDINELSKTLEPIKIKMYGQDIIHIINKHYK